VVGQPQQRERQRSAACGEPGDSQRGGGDERGSQYLIGGQSFLHHPSGGPPVPPSGRAGRAGPTPYSSAGRWVGTRRPRSAPRKPAGMSGFVRFCPVLSGSSPPVGGHRAPKTRQPGIPAGPPDGVGPARNDPAGGPRGTSWWQRPKRAIGPFLCSPVRGVPPGQFRACRNPVVRRTSGSSAGPRRGSSARPRPCATLPRQGTSFDSP